MVDVVCCLSQHTTSSVGEDVVCWDKRFVSTNTIL